MNEKYWLTPPELYQKLDKEFNFDFDPCPYPKTFDSLKMPWGKMNYVNPPFKKEDGGTAPFIHKAIEESKSILAKYDIDDEQIKILNDYKNKI